MPLEIAAAPELRETAASGLFLQRSRCLLRLLQLQSCEKLLLQASFFRGAGVPLKLQIRVPEAEDFSLRVLEFRKPPEV